MPWVIQIIGNAAGLPCPEVEHYVKSMDFEAYDGFGSLVVTNNPRKAMFFGSPGSAHEFYRRTPVCKPVRPDGRPNRPLTAYIVDIHQVSAP
jgi:hypothetical protein